MQKKVSLKMLLSISLLTADNSLTGMEVPTRGSLFESFRAAKGLTDAQAFEKLLRISTMEIRQPITASLAEGVIKSLSFEKLLLISLEQKEFYISIFAAKKIESRVPVPDEEQIEKVKTWLIKKAKKITEEEETKKETNKKKKKKLTRKN